MVDFLEVHLHSIEVYDSISTPHILQTRVTSQVHNANELNGRLKTYADNLVIVSNHAYAPLFQAD